MTDFTPKPNTYNQNHGNKKKIIAAVSVVAAVTLILVVFLIAKNAIFFSLAESKAENGNYKSAVSLADKSGSDGADILKEYAVLRIEINKYYPLLLSDFNLDKIREWSEIAKKINAGSYLLNDELSAEIMELDTALAQIISCCEEYGALKKDILNMMDAFAEINRLHTKDAEGKNTSFTVAQERAKINEWTQINGRMLAFVAQIPRSENLYLINFLAKEAQGEIADFAKTIDGVAALYGETALVRFSGDANKQYPDISNSSGKRVNLLEKEGFEQFMYEELCSELVRSLAGFYSA